MTTYSDFQGLYNGFSFGPPTSIQILSIDGLETMPDIRNASLPRSRDYGDYVGINRPSSRYVDFKFLVLGDATNSFRTYLDQLQDAFVPMDSDLPLTFQLPGRSPQRIYGRPNKRATTIDSNYAVGYAGVDVLFYCKDPLIYDETQSQMILNLPTSGGGLQMPVQMPANFGASATGGSAIATNDGNYPTRPIAVIQGPSTNPRIENVRAGFTVQFTITLGSSDSLTIDFDAKSVLLNGTASRRNTMTANSTWWDLQPGDSEIRYRGDVFNAGSTMTLTWRGANI